MRFWISESLRLARLTDCCLGTHATWAASSARSPLGTVVTQPSHASPAFGRTNLFSSRSHWTPVNSQVLGSHGRDIHVQLPRYLHCWQDREAGPRVRRDLGLETRPQTPLS